MCQTDCSSDVCSSDLAQLRIRLIDGSRPIESKVGPVGDFSMEYNLGRAMPNGIDELMERHGITYDLRGWEIVPEFGGRDRMSGVMEYGVGVHDLRGRH